MQSASDILLKDGREIEKKMKDQDKKIEELQRLLDEEKALRAKDVEDRDFEIKRLKDEHQA